MTNWRVQVALRCSGSSSEDVFVNTWALQSSDGSIDSSRGVEILDCFYDNFYQPLCETWYNTQILALGSTFKIYEIGGAPDSPPVYSFTWPSSPLVAVAGGIDLPWEVAVCLSFEAVLGGGPRPRRRGRVYLGPLNSVIISSGSGGAPSVTESARGQMVTCYQDLAAALLDGPEMDIGIYSKTDDVFIASHHCWVDDAFDTQRRRGNKASTRTAALVTP